MKISTNIPKLPGTYVIHVPGAKEYIGSSSDLYRRVLKHASELNRGVHPIKDLQNDHDSCNDNVDVTFTVLDTKEAALDNEQSLLDARISTGTLYNMATNARASQQGLRRTLSEETKLKMSESRKGTEATKEKIEKMSAARRGKPMSEEHKAKIKEANKNSQGSINALLQLAESRQQPISVNNVVYPSSSIAAKELGITTNTVFGRVKSPNFPDWRKVDE